MSRPPRRRPAALAALAGLLLLTACGDDAAPAAPRPADPTENHLQTQLDALPTVDGASRTARTYADATLTETFTVPAGTPACLQVLARLDAGGYEVVAGTRQSVVTPDTCRAADDDPAVDTTQGTTTILAQGGSEIALRWTTTAYTVSVTSP